MTHNPPSFIKYPRILGFSHTLVFVALTDMHVRWIIYFCHLSSIVVAYNWLGVFGCLSETRKDLMEFGCV